MKANKTFMIVNLIIATILNVNSIKAQGNNLNQSGIYLTATDFVANKLAYRIDCDTNSHKIILHDFLNKPYIDIIHEGQKYTLKKNEIFSYRDCENQNFRFYNNEELLIKEVNKLCIYAINKSVPATTGKGFETKEVFYFSNGLNGEIQLLTLLNLKKAFPDNHKFHDSLDAFFKDDTNIFLYDNFHKMYKVNHIFSESIK